MPLNLSSLIRLFSRTAGTAAVFALSWSSLNAQISGTPGDIVIRSNQNAANLATNPGDDIAIQFDRDVLAATDDDLLARARFAAESLIGPFPPFAAHRVFRHPKAIPQYHLGHLERVAALRETEENLPGLFLTGYHLDGIAVKDCIRAGEATASRVASAG